MEQSQSGSEKKAGSRLIDAIKARDQAQVREALAGGADIHERAEQEWTPLNYAAGLGDLEMVKLLVEKGADITLAGRDNRTALMIAKAAGRKEVAAFLTEQEKQRGVWKDPALTCQYCKAYYLRDLRAFPGWKESRLNWKINKYWSDEMKSDYEKPFEDADVAFLHQDFTATKSMWHGENVIFEDVTAEWKTFCRETLKFAIPEDLL